MFHKLLSYTCALALLLVTSCATPGSNTGIGAGLGAAIGAGAGALLGSKGVKKEGAMIGGAIGALLGGGIGNYLDKQKQELQKAGVDAKVENGKIVANLKGDILFKPSRSDLSSDSQSKLSELASVLAKYNEANNLVISGHTDTTGNDSINLPLSQNRANAVKTYLVMNGVSGNAISTSGHGSAQPIADNTSPTGRAANRRVTIEIIPNESAVNTATGK